MTPIRGQLAAAIFGCMHCPNVLVVVVDGLRASALGAYGNTSFSTPDLDRFAADSLLHDWCYSPSADLADIYRAMWQSIHPARSLERGGNQEGAARASHSLPSQFTHAGYKATLITDESRLSEFAGAADFDERVDVSIPAGAIEKSDHADDTSRTHLARLFAAATEVVSTTQPQLLWVHSRGMYGPWEAPLELQRSLLDDDDQAPVKAIASPDFSRKPGDDPDAVFRYGCAYAAQAIVLDDCWKGLLEVLESTGGDAPWLVMLTGARGFPLGEHGRIGGVDARLYTEQLHVPWLLRFPDGRGRLARSSRLVSHLDVLPTLFDWLDGDNYKASPDWDGSSALSILKSASAASREALVSVSSDQARCIRTADWCLREDAAAIEAPENSELFVRPDDRWEANNVAKLCSEVVEELRITVTTELARLR